MSNFWVDYTYRIRDLYSNSLNRIRRSTDRFQRSSRRASASLRRFSASTVNAQGAVGAMAGALGGAAALNQFKGYQESINRLSAVTLASTDDMDKMEAMAKKLGASTEFSASQAASGMIFLAQAGLNTNKVLSTIPGTLKLATAGGLELSQAADIATNVLAQMGLQSEDSSKLIRNLTRVNDSLAAVQANANTNIIQAAEALKNLGTTASSLGIGLSETVSLIGSMANAGVKGGEAGTLLRNALLKIISPSNKARKAMRRLRIDMGQFVTPDGKIKNFTDLVGLLGKKGATTQQIFSIFEERGARAILALQASGSKSIKKLTVDIEASSGVVDKMSKRMQVGLPSSFKKIASSLESLNIAIFESGLADFLGESIDKITELVRGVSKLNPVLLKMGGFFALAVVVGAPLILALGLIASAGAVVLGFLGSMSVVGVAAFVAVSGAVVYLISRIGMIKEALSVAVKFWSSVGNKIANVSFEFISNSIEYLTSRIELLKEAFNSVVGSVSSFMDMISSLTFGSVFSKIKDIVGGGVSNAKIAIGIDEESKTSVVKEIKDLVGNGLSSVKIALGANADSDAISSAKMASSVGKESKINIVKEIKNNVVADFQRRTSGTLNGKIGIDVTGPGSVRKSEMTTSFPGNLGFNNPAAVF